MNPYHYSPDDDDKQGDEEYRPVGIYYDFINLFVPLLLIFLTPGVPILVGNTLNYSSSMIVWMMIVWPFSLFILSRYFIEYFKGY